MNQFFRNLPAGFAMVFLLLLLGSSPGPEPYKILFGGDTSFGEIWHQKAEKKGKKNPLKEYGYGKMVGDLGPLLKESDFVLANLETALVSDGTPFPKGKKRSDSNRGNPEAGPEAWEEMGIDAFSMANNHAFDFGKNGLEQTFPALAGHNIKTFGAGFDLNEAAEPLVLKAGKLTLVVQPCFWEDKSMREKYHYYAGQNSAGVMGIDSAGIRPLVKSLREKYPDAFLIFYPHWGKNYRWRTKTQKELGRLMIKSGADMVVGHGAHMMQEVEYYRSKWIIYGLGNFIYGAPGRYQKEEAAMRWSLILQLQTNPKKAELSSIRLYPFFCDNLLNNYHPRFAQRSEMELQRIMLLRRFDLQDEEWKKCTIKGDNIAPYLELEI